MNKPLTILILFSTFFFCGFGQFNFPFMPPKVKITTTAIPHTKTSFYVVVTADLRNGWFIYWKNSGTVTQATKFSNFKLPKGVTLEEIIYPTPSHKISKSNDFWQVSHLYKKAPRFLLKFKSDKKYINQSIKGSFNITYQGCDAKICDVPKNETYEFLVNMDGSLATYSIPFIQEIEKNLPQKLPTELKLQKKIENNILYLSFQHTDNIAEAYFFSASNDIFEKNQNWKQNDNGLVELTIPFPKNAKTKGNGVLKIITKDEKVLSYQINTAIDTIIEYQQQSSLSYYLFLAFIGGLILNLMPCVFPILAIKILSFVNQAHQEKSHSIKYALAFSFGILVSFWTLAGLIIISKASGGNNLIWGFQLQNPFFIAFLITLLAIMSLNFFGIFEFILPWTPQTKGNGYLGSFSSGLLATLIATPCVAPFMSIALVAALTLSSFEAWLIFTLLGLGMAAPYLLLCIFPRLMKWVPKPGNWMITFKKVMGFLLLGSAIWFMETFAALTSVELLIKFALLLCILSLGFWFYGYKAATDRESKSYKISFIALIINIVVCSSVIYKDIAYEKQLYNLPESKRIEVMMENTIVWQKFSEEKFEELQKQQRKIFVDFTATWCASCKWNEQAILIPNRKIFQNNKVAMLKADCTKENHPFKKILQRYKSTGIPLYLYFDGQKVHKLPNLLSTRIIKNLFIEKTK